MKVYNTGPKHHTLHVAPAAMPGTVKEGASADWLNDDGTPKTLEVKFVSGQAEVDKNLGEWLIKNGFAKRTALILPRLVA